MARRRGRSIMHAVATAGSNRGDRDKCRDSAQDFAGPTANGGESGRTGRARCVESRIHGDFLAPWPQYFGRARPLGPPRHLRQSTLSPAGRRGYSYAVIP